MRYIENYELREWVKESLRKSIFQKAHALAVQTGCEILVKLEDVTDVSGPQYYATRNLQQAYRHGGVCEKPGERCIAGDTGLPTIHTAEIAVQSCIEEGPTREPVFSIRSRNNHNTNQHAKSSPNNSVIPSHLHAAHHANKTIGVQHVVQHQQQQRTKAVMRAVHEQQNTNIVSNNMQSTVSETPGDMHVNTPVEPVQTSVTDPPANVKMEVHDVVDNDDVEKDDTFLDHMVCDDVVDNNVMAPLSHEDDFYEDHFGTSGELDDSGSQSGLQGAMIPQQSEEVGSHFQQLQHMPGIGTGAFASSSASGTDGSSQLIVPKSATRMYKFPRTHSPKTVTQTNLSAEIVASMLSYPVTLPNFSSSVQYALENGHVHSGKMWSQFCKESSQFYQPLLDIYDSSDFHDTKSSSIVYQSIGRTMYEKYPCIAGNGIRPWTLFNKWLSTKIRQARFQIKKKEDQEKMPTSQIKINLPVT
ncbi:uncharacterized protein [Amphiura filiformis]|uniref:uncharacterized protein n=1 Tax=Amphiura filiformis TaxID=82378 RepID=UPI003B210CDB